MNNNPGWMDKVLDALRSPGAMMVALVLALFPQGEHTAQVFLYFSHDRSSNAQFFAYAFAAAVEVAVLLFVLAGHKRISYLFAGASFLTNVVYYAIGGVAMLTVSVLPVLLLSALLPACIMGYSHTIAEKPQTAAHPAKATKAARPTRWQFWKKPAETTGTNIEPVKPVKTTVAIPAVTTGHSSASPDAAEQTSVTSDAPQGDKLTKEQRRALIAEWQLQKAEQVMESFGVGKRTADGDLAWVRSNVMHTNGVAK